MPGLTKDRRQRERRTDERQGPDRRQGEDRRLGRDRRATPRVEPPTPDTAQDLLPPGPRRPAFVQTLEWIADPKRFMTRCRRRYGDAFSVRLGPSTDVVFLSDPAAVKEVFQGPPEHMNMGDINGLFRRVLGRNSLLVLDGPEHMRQRKLLLPPFHGERIARHRDSMVRAADEDVESWPIGEPFPLQPRMQAMTLNVILRAVFGMDDGPRRDELRALLARLLELNTTLATTLPQLRIELGGLTPWGKLMRCTAEVDRAIYAEMARRREVPNAAQDDVLSLLLEARDESGEPMSDREIRDQLLTMLVAGHETTATALAWAFERMLRHPDVVARLRADMEAGDSRYLDAAIKESLRLRPVVPIAARKLSAPLTVAGRRYPAGTVLMPCIFLLHRNPAVYDAPDRFRPERFLDDQPGTYSWIPFGGGVRRCLGASFALLEMRIVIESVLRHLELRPATRRDERIVRRAFTLSPRRGARVVATRVRARA
jgi:cytochrome P450 family 135